MLERLGLAEHRVGIKKGRRLNDPSVHLREMLEELGPTFVKMDRYYLPGLTLSHNPISVN